MLATKGPVIPQLKDYDISPLTGFLPPEGPLRRLPGTYFEPWEDIMDQLSALLLCGRYRDRVAKVRMQCGGLNSCSCRCWTLASWPI